MRPIHFNMLRRYRLLFLIGIIFFAAVLRLYQLGVTPVSPDWDEVALGYNAYSIIQTGKDEYGAFLPVVLRSYDDYKPALYTYLAIPPIFVFGLTVFATRLPSAIFGILTIFITYLLIREVFKKESLALITSFLLAISPWHIQFSRVAFETNIGLSLNILTAYLFVKGLKKPWVLILSAFSAGLAIYAYQSEKVFTPLFVLVLVLIFARQLFSLPKKYLLTAAITGILVVTPMFVYITSHKEALLRAQATLAFSDQTSFLKNQIKRVNYDHLRKDYLGLVLDNRRVLFLLTGVGGYLSHYDLNWLFFKGDLTRHHAPGMGLMYLWELPFLLIGLYALFFSRLESKEKRGKYLFFAWFLLAPVPAAFTSDLPHAVRTLNFLPTFQLFTAWGILSAVQMIRVYKERKGTIFSKLFPVFVLCFLFFAVGNFAYYLNQYFVQQNYFYSRDWQYGYADTVDYIKKVDADYDKIVVSNKQPLDDSYMFFLFYLKYPPEKYQRESLSKSGGYDIRHSFGKFEFRPVHWDTEVKKDTILYVEGVSEYGGGNIVKPVDFLDGTPAIKIVQG